MKRTFALFTFLLFVTIAFSQNIVHTFYMKDGSIFEGVILEKKDNSYRVQTSTGNELEFEADISY